MELWDLVLETNLLRHGVTATVTRPAPDDAAIATRVIWLTTNTENDPAGLSLQRKGPRRVAVLSRTAVPTVPKGTLIVAAERPGATAQTWRVDGTDSLYADHTRVVVVPAPET